MASKQSTVDFIVEQSSATGTVSAKKMFGEYGMFSGEKWDDRAWLSKLIGITASQLPVPKKGAKEVRLR